MSGVTFAIPSQSTAYHRKVLFGCIGHLYYECFAGSGVLPINSLHFILEPPVRIAIVDLSQVNNILSQ